MLTTRKLVTNLPFKQEPVSSVLPHRFAFFRRMIDNGL
ncbi:beta-hydroxyacyl-(acyl-carrier-protein) dehydratase FabZ [Alicyclobacillus hesperidum URH17-3-68]|nr:beta-hydroxyacyl-(acyl-carrier-protein) dehydratase FabZ [Alicyclobacillus hesperidum URH17-3-68]